MYEDAIDDELDSMADKINKDYKYTDAVKDAEDMADDMLNSEDDYFNDQKSHKLIFNTIDE